MPDTRYFFACAQEQCPPDDLLKQAVEAARTTSSRGGSRARPTYGDKVLPAMRN